MHGHAAGTRDDRLLDVYSLFSWRHPRDFKSTNVIPKWNLVSPYAFTLYLVIITSLIACSHEIGPLKGGPPTVPGSSLLQSARESKSIGGGVLRCVDGAPPP